MEQTIFKADEEQLLKQYIKGFDPDTIFLVRGEGSYTASGAQHFIEDALELKETASFHGFSVNPKIEDLKKGIELFQKGNYKLIIAIGGGSVLDMGKLISVMAHQEDDLSKLIDGSLPLKPIKTPLLAIPTTAGTGAEATMFAVIYMDNQKYSVSNLIVLPDKVYLSAHFLKTANPYLAATTGLDALAQAMESVWSVNATPESLAYAYQAVELIWNSLPEVVKGSQGEPMNRMMEGSFLAGKAINISKTTAPHAISYAFTTHYGIPHGHAVALSLPFFLRFNFQVNEKCCTDPQGPSHVQQKISKLHSIMNTSPENAYSKLRGFISSLGLEVSIDVLIPNFESSLITDNVNTERLNNNPRKVTKGDVIEFIKNGKRSN